MAQQGQNVPDQAKDLPAIPGDLAKHAAPPLGPPGSVPDNEYGKHGGAR